MPTTPSTINYYIAADGTLRDGQAGSIAQTPRIYYGTEYAVTLSFPPSTIAEGDQLQVAVNRTRTFFSSASATGDAPVAAVAKHDVTAAEADAQAVTLTLSTNTRAMIDQVNGIDHPVRGFFGVHVLRGQSFISLAVADAFMLSVESGPDAISPSLPVVDYPTREEAEQIKQDTIAAQEKAEEAQGKAEEAQGKAEEAQGAAETAQGKAEDAQGAAETAQGAAVSAKGAAETAATNAEKIAEGSDADVEPLGLEHSAKGWAQEAAATLASKRDILQTLVTSSSTSLEVEAGKSYKWTVSAASTISMAAADKVANKETRIDIYIDLQDGGSVTGSGVVIADSVLQSGWYKLIWDGTNATLYSTKAGGAESVITIPASTTAYSLQDNKHYQQVPSSVPTYTLPAVTMDGLVHEITILVDFLHVTSCSYVDASNVPVTLQSAISPQIGEAYVFRCYWYGKWRVVPLKIRNAATATSSTGVVQVSDAVAGDALALKMTAPRSVVVNQHINTTDTSVTLTNGKTWLTKIGGVSEKVTGTGQSVACTGGTDMAVDLTQYFNGDTTLIDSITSWDDLVAYDPRFASYVEYNTGTVEGVQPSVQVTGKNLFDKTQTLTNGFYNDQNIFTSSYNWRTTSLIPVKAGSTITGTYPSYGGDATSLRMFDVDQNYIGLIKHAIISRTYKTYVLDAGCCFVQDCFKVEDLNTYQLELGSTATAYEPYHDGGTAQAPSELFAVGNAADEYEAVSGVTTRNMGSYTFTGDEVWTCYNSYMTSVGGGGFCNLNIQTASKNVVCNALIYTSSSLLTGNEANVCNVARGSNPQFYVKISWTRLGVSDYTQITNAECETKIKEYFKAQYDAGTPVVIKYVLATPTTSTSTPAQIALQAGDNVAMQTDGGRTLAELSMTYENLPAED